MDIEGEGEDFKRGYWERDKGSTIEVSMKIRLLSWNVRGANDVEKREIIKATIKTQRVDLVCL